MYQDRAILPLCDLVLTNSAGMRDALAEFRRNVAMLESGVDSPRPRRRCPSDLRRLPRPILGYAGNLSARIDIELLRRLALRHPEWSLRSRKCRAREREPGEPQERAPTRRPPDVHREPADEARIRR